MNNFEFTDNDYNKYSIIKPPEDSFDDIKFDRIVIDSSYRNKNLFPEPNNYEIQLQDDIEDIICVKLIYANIPFNSYLINKNYNVITFNNNKITLDIGDYSYTDMASHLSSKLGITVTHNVSKNTFSFSSASSFNIYFDNELSNILGFKKEKIYSSEGSGPYTLNSEFKIDFDYNNYYILYINQFDLLKNQNQILNGSFAIIPKKYTDLNISDEAKYIKTFNPPIAKIYKLSIKFYDKYGNLVDFQNKDHLIELNFKKFKQKRKYKNIFT